MVQHNEQLTIDGSQDETQLTVQGHSTQTEALQSWQDSAGEEQARLTGDGRLQIGSINSGMMATDDALIEVHRDEVDSTMPKRGLNLLGEMTDTLSSAVQWVVHELVLKGTTGVSALHAALRVKLTNQNTGDSSVADLRAGDFEAVNEAGSVNSVGQLVGVHATATTQNSSTTTDAIGVDVEVNQSGGTVSNAYGIRVSDIDTTGNDYAIHTGSGVVHLGDVLEIPVQASDPTSSPENGYITVYLKTVEGQAQLWGKPESGDAYALGGGSTNTSGGNGFALPESIASTDTVMIDNNQQYTIFDIDVAGTLEIAGTLNIA